MNELERLEGFTKEYEAICAKYKMGISRSGDDEIQSHEDNWYTPEVAEIDDKFYRYNFDDEKWELAA